MSRRIKISHEVCGKCIFRMYVNGQPVCNYLAITEHSRIFKDGKQQYPAHLCNKFIEGKQLEMGWTSDSMTEWRQEEIKQKLWKELEDANDWR